MPLLGSLTRAGNELTQAGHHLQITDFHLYILNGNGRARINTTYCIENGLKINAEQLTVGQ